MLKNKGALNIYFGASYPIGNEELLYLHIGASRIPVSRQEGVKRELKLNTTTMLEMDVCRKCAPRYDFLVNK